ncbi:MAG: phosphatidylserine decarboxylase, partial [Pseudomonadales bacterium]
MNKIFTSILAGLFLTASVCNTANARQDAEPVKQLKELYNGNEDFRKTLDMAFQNLQPQPDGSANPWQGKSVDDLYDYFNDWFYFLPDTSNGLEYIEGFTWLYYKNPHGLKVVNEEPGLSWTKHFVVERGKYMDSKASAQGVEKWLHEPSVHMEDFVVPQQGFQSFNEFFTRDIKPGARPIAAVSDNAVVVAPADCVMNMINSSLTAGAKIPLKGRMQLNVNELLHDSAFASHFVGGTAV